MGAIPCFFLDCSNAYPGAMNFATYDENVFMESIRQENHGGFQEFF
jgi:hypothetical protein